ncbi:acyltransferase family protein [Shigella flexneri]
MVLISHHYALSGQLEPYIFGFESAGGIAVIIFFSISGYLISKSAIRSDSFIDFMAKRARRIFPALVPCSVLTYFLFGWMLNNFSTEYFSHDIHPEDHKLYFNESGSRCRHYITFNSSRY